MKTVKLSTIEESIYKFIGEVGSVTPGTLYGHLGVTFFPAEAWLRREVERGYLYENGEGRYSVSCPIAA